MCTHGQFAVEGHHLALGAAEGVCGLVVGAVDAGAVDEGRDAVELVADARVALAPRLRPRQLQQRRAAVLRLVHVLVPARGGNLALPQEVRTSNLYRSKIHSNSHLLSLRHLLEEGVAARQYDGEAGLLELAPQRLTCAALPVLLDLALQQSQCYTCISLHF